jgi:DNA polymerase
MNLAEYQKHTDKQYVSNSNQGINNKSNPDISPNDAQTIEDLQRFLNNTFNKNKKHNFNLIEGNQKSKILFMYGKCTANDNRILDGEPGQLFDKMLEGIKINRDKIALCSYIPRGLEEIKENDSFIQTMQIINYRIIELLNPKFLIILSNFCIKMLLATDLSSMSLRGKWFDFNTPNDITPKKCRVLYEPLMLINNPELKKEAWEDLKEISRQLGG